MQVKKQALPTTRIEPRWPVALTVIVVLAVLTLTPSRVRVLPFWVTWILGIALFLPSAGVWLSGASARWSFWERIATLLFAAFAQVMTVGVLAYLMVGILNRPEDFDGRQLLATSVGAWVTNVLAFSLVYWRIDRGGPEGRVNDVAIRPDWLFPQPGVPDQAPPDWRPTFVDYLFLAFSTATAFSATEVTPLTPRAKLLMMFESTVSLGTLVIVASRAINILGD